MYTVAKVRDSFLDFFISKGHYIQESASLLPTEDPTLLFTSAGMVPFKSYFSGIREPPSKRIASIQKCMRTTDLSEVGNTKRHLSFFEMLGNFSFGDYFKKEAIEFSWEYSTQILPFTKEDIWISIFHEDNESFQIWKNHIGIPEEKIVPLDKKHNFWGPAGNTGPCGPCSELYLDRGYKYDIQNQCKKPGDDGERFLEFWNLVFNQYNKNQSARYEKLKNTGIDTGAGLERISTLIQGVDSVFETNELRQLCQNVEKIYRAPYQQNQKAIHILADHIRTAAFSIADGIYPSNESRGYVIRRILRRAMLHAKRLGKKEASMHYIAEEVIKIYSPFYKTLKEQKKNILNIIHREEERFLDTLQFGLDRLQEIIEKSRHSQVISGKDAFLLHDSYGLPVELTLEIAEQESLRVEMNYFEEEMKKQKKRGRLAWKGDSISLPLAGLPQIFFTGYDKQSENGILLRIIHKNIIKERLSEIDLHLKDHFYLISDKTCFYPEGGGQNGDEGIIKGESFEVQVMDTQKFDEIIFHVCENLKGEVTIGDKICLRIKQEKKEKLKKNHSATHLLNAALRSTLGKHIQQSGSLVHEDYLRFDFTHPKSLSSLEIESIENKINEVIGDSKEVKTLIMPKEEAKRLGAVMTFGEKYGDVVRVVKMGDFSIEFCGGTHVENTSNIKCVLLMKEGSPGSGNRRIEAVSDEIAFSLLQKTINENLNSLSEIEKLIKMSDVPKGYLEERHAIKKIHQEYKHRLSRRSQQNTMSSKEAVQLWQEVRKSKIEIHEFKNLIKKKIKKAPKAARELESEDIDEILSTVQEKQGTQICSFSKNGFDIPSLKQLADSLREKNPDTLFLLNSLNQEGKKTRLNLVLATTKAFANRLSFDGDRVIKEMLAELTFFKGGGGGKTELAQASGHLIEALNGEYVSKKLEEVFLGKLK